MKDFWENKTVLVTGHTGFKGGWLCLWLQQLGARVVGYALKAPTRPNLFESARLQEGLLSIIADVRDCVALKQTFDEHAPDIVFHMAAQSLVRYSYSNPVETYATNVMGTANVLEAVRKSTRVKAVVTVTSDKCYDNREWIWGYRENDPVGGYDPYSSSKGCAELVTSAFRNSFFNPADYDKHGVALASARAGNVIGGGDWAQDRLVPDFIRAVSRGEPLLVRNPSAVRPWQHVLEPLHGYLLLAQALWTQNARYSEAWNFGPNAESEQSVEKVVTRLANLWDGSAEWRRDPNTNHPHEATYLKLDCSKARAKLGWRPYFDFETALDWTAAWYGAYSRKRDMRDFTLDQVAAYMARINA